MAHRFPWFLVPEYDKTLKIGDISNEAALISDDEEDIVDMDDDISNVPGVFDENDDETISDAISPNAPIIGV